MLTAADRVFTRFIAAPPPPSPPPRGGGGEGWGLSGGGLRRRWSEGPDIGYHGRWLSLGRVQLLPRVLDHRDRLEFDIGEFAVQLLGAAEVDVLDDVAGIAIDHDR